MIFSDFDVFWIVEGPLFLILIWSVFRPLFLYTADGIELCCPKELLGPYIICKNRIPLKHAIERDCYYIFRMSILNKT